MAAKLTSLIELEQIDIEIARLENSKEEFPRKVVEMEALLASKREKLSAIERSIIEQEVGYKKADQTLAECQDALDTSHVRLNAVHNNREYDAVLLEIQERKEMIDRAHKKKVKFAELKQQFEQEKTDLQAAYEAELAEMQPQIDDLKSKIASIDDDIAGVMAKRAEVAPLVPANYMSIYVLIARKRKSGHVLAHVKSSSRACTHCFQVINPNILKRAQAATSPVTCENCGSILVFDEPAQEI